MSDAPFDVAIVGGGIAGASAAFFLARSGMTVAVLEQEDGLGVHSTGRSAAVFVEEYGNRAVRSLTQSSRSFLEVPPHDFSETPLLTPRGMLTIAPQAELSLLAEAQRQRHPARAIWLTPAEISLRHPAVQERYVAAALYDPTACDMDVNAIHQGFLRGAQACGAQIRPSSRTTALERDAGYWTITGNFGSIAAKFIVNAAGAWADQVAIMAGATPVGLRPLKRTAILFDPSPDADIAQWPFVVDLAETFYFKPDAGKILASPADATPAEPGDVYADEWDIAVAVDRVQRASTLNVRRVSHSWAGLRTFAPDDTPVVGFDSRIPGFFWLAGLGGFGIQTTPAIGDLAAALIQRQQPPEWAESEELPRSLSPARFRTSSPPNASPA